MLGRFSSFVFSLLMILSSSACNNRAVVRSDSGVVIDDDSGNTLVITAEQIGTACRYINDGTGENPDNTCPKGLQCLLQTSDGKYGKGFANKWEDQFSLYPTEQVGGFDVDEGFCTYIGSQSNLQFRCPVGTYEKLFSSGIVACMKECASSSDCRDGYVCDSRYYEPNQSGQIFGVPTCVKACQNDAPDCVASGTVLANGQLLHTLHYEGFEGKSVCHETTRTCQTNTEVGTVKPGGACTGNEDCLGDAMCYGTHFFTGIDDATGVCIVPCVPVVKNPQAADNTAYLTASYQACKGLLGAQYICQEFPTYGHEPNYIFNPELTPNYLKMGGACLPACQEDPGVCVNQFTGTSCGSLSPDLMQTWNGVSMCLLPFMKN